MTSPAWPIRAPSRRCAVHNAWLSSLASGDAEGHLPFREAFITARDVGQHALNVELHLATHAAPGVPRGDVVIRGKLDLE